MMPLPPQSALLLYSRNARKRKGSLISTPEAGGEQRIIT